MEHQPVSVQTASSEGMVCGPKEPSDVSYVHLSPPYLAEMNLLHGGEMVVCVVLTYLQRFVIAVSGFIPIFAIKVNIP